MAVTDMTPANETQAQESEEEAKAQPRTRRAAKPLTRGTGWTGITEEPPPMLGVAILSGKRLGIFPDWLDGLKGLKRYPPGTVIRTRNGIMARRVPDSWLPDEDIQEQQSEEDVTEIIQELGCDYAKRNLSER